MTVVGRGPKGCGAAMGHEGRPQLVPAGAGAVNRSRALPKARVTARFRLHERVSRRDQPTSRVGICSMSRSFGTLVQLNTLLQVCTKLGLTRDGRMPDLGSDQGAKYKASEFARPEGPRTVHRFVHSSLHGRYHRFSSWLRTFRITPKVHTDISDHSQGPLSRRMAEKGVEGSGSRANLALQKQKLSQNH